MLPASVLYDKKVMGSLHNDVIVYKAQATFFFDASIKIHL